MILNVNQMKIILTLSFMFFITLNTYAQKEVCENDDYSAIDMNSIDKCPIEVRNENELNKELRLVSKPDLNRVLIQTKKINAKEINDNKKTKVLVNKVAEKEVILEVKEHPIQ